MPGFSGEEIYGFSSGLINTRDVDQSQNSFQEQVLVPFLQVHLFIFHSQVLTF